MCTSISKHIWTCGSVFEMRTEVRFFKFIALYVNRSVATSETHTYTCYTVKYSSIFYSKINLIVRIYKI
jgi:hypothetical protein